MALHNAPPEFAEARSREPLFSPAPSNPLARVAATKATLQIADLRLEESYLSGEQATVIIAERGGARTLIDIPMLKDGELVGVFGIYRQEVRPFTDKQVELLQNFAAQAVIAIENTRLLNELRQRTDDLTESLEQQTVTAEVLRVISTSPGDLQPVFEAILENATRICEAKFGQLFLVEDGTYRAGAMHNVPTEYLAHRRAEPHVSMTGDSAMGRVAATKQAIQIADVSADPGYQHDESRRRFVAMTRARTIVSVPMLKDGDLVGAINVYRAEVRPFTDKQMELLTNFATQAVIAIENTRLLNELRQSLEQQTATADVLRVISASPGELEPVFNAMLANAVRICNARFGNLLLFDGRDMRMAAMHNAPRAYEEARRGDPVVPMNSIIGPLVTTKKLVHINDLAADERFANSMLAKVAGARTALAVPMLRDNELVGAIAIYQQDVHPFTDKQIDLVSNFAAQAVIAIENTRLLNELRQRTDDLSEALDQQTATSEVLRVISSSPGELEPVFQAVLENAVRICDAKFGVLFRYDDEFFDPAAMFGVPPAHAEHLLQRGRFQTEAESSLDRLVRTREVIRIADEAARANPGGAAKFGGARSFVAVPMLNENRLIGAIVIYRQEVRPFTDKQVDLVRNFAAQAVIAIENTRLLNELWQRTTDLTESLEQQTAISEILRVISNSPSDVQPVLDSVAEHAARICEARIVDIIIPENNVMRVCATFGDLGRPVAGEMVRLDRSTVMGRSICDLQPVHVADLQNAADEFASGRELAIKYGHRSILAVPLIREGRALGAILVRRTEVRPFEQKHIALLTTFADQAAIAIENVRLFKAEQERTEELSASLEQQTATANVLDVISRSAFDLRAVFETVAESSARLCGADRANIFRFDGKVLRVVTGYNAPQKLIDWLEQNPIQPGRHSVAARAAFERRSVQVADVLADPEHTYAAKSVDPFRTVLAVPILKGDDLLGVILVYHTVVRPFTDKQIALVETFADQAAIAIENVRLFEAEQKRTEELSAALEQQTATADVLKIISRSTFDLQTVLDTLVEFGRAAVRSGEGLHQPQAWRWLSRRRDARLLARVQGIHGRAPDPRRHRLSRRSHGDGGQNHPDCRRDDRS